MSADEPAKKTDRPAESEVPVPDDEALAEARKKVEEIDARYEPGARETVVLTGSDGTVSGTAFDDYVDNDGNLKEPEPEKDS